MDRATANNPGASNWRLANMGSHSIDIKLLNNEQALNVNPNEPPMGRARLKLGTIIENDNLWSWRIHGQGNFQSPGNPPADFWDVGESIKGSIRSGYSNYKLITYPEASLNGEVKLGKRGQPGEKGSGEKGKGVSPRYFVVDGFVLSVY